MSRRRMAMLACVVVVSVVGLGCYLPHYLSPDPELVAACRSDFVFIEEDADPIDPNLDPNQGIQIDLLFASLNITRAGSPLLAMTDEPKMVRGTIKGNQGLPKSLQQVPAKSWIHLYSTPKVVTSTGRPAHVMFGQEVTVPTEDGSGVELKLIGTALEALPTLCKDGRIHMQLHLTLSEMKVPVANKPEIVTLKAKGSILVSDGSTCFVGGLRHKVKHTEIHQVPLLGELPGVGPSFQFTREVEIDEELLILATPRRVTLAEEP